MADDEVVAGPLALRRVDIDPSWIPQSNSMTPSKERVAEPGADGDELVSELIDGKTEISDEFVHPDMSGPVLIFPDVGKVYSGYLLTGFRLACSSNGWPKLSVTAHQHDNNAHAALPHHYAASLAAINTDFGVPLLGALGENAGLASLEYEVSCQHIDEPDGIGGHLAGACFNGHERLTLGFTGVPTTPFTAVTGWDLVSEPSTDSAEAFSKYTYVYEKALARTATV